MTEREILLTVGALGSATTLVWVVWNLTRGWRNRKRDEDVDRDQ